MPQDPLGQLLGRETALKLPFRDAEKATFS